MVNQEKVELNFFYLHWRDARKLTELAETEVSKLRSLYARHAILASVFAVEAMVNKLLNDFYVLQSGRNSFQKLGLKERISLCPLVCGKGTPMGRIFDQSREPFQGFAELVDIRNWLVHPKRGNFIDARREFGFIQIADTQEDLPWIETDFSSVWPHTRIPVNPFELTGEHARQAFDLTNRVIEEMKSLFSGLLTDKWFDEMRVRSKDGKHEEILTIQSLWGGYTPDKKDN